MVTENEIKNQTEITKTILEDDSGKHPLSEHEWCLVSGYLQALEFVLGNIPAKYNKEDI
jgi:hypothetical protein